MTEPFYIRQTSGPRTDAEMRDWFMKCYDEAKADGGHFARFSCHPDVEGLLLVEVWKERHVADQGPQRWSLEEQCETDRTSKPIT